MTNREAGRHVESKDPYSLASPGPIPAQHFLHGILPFRKKILGNSRIESGVQNRFVLLYFPGSYALSASSRPSP